MRKLNVSRSLILSALICLMGFASLSQTTLSTDSKLSRQLISEWRNVYIKIVLHHKTDPVVTMDADSSNWEERLKIKPIRTHFIEDGSYYSEYRNLNDSLVRKASGIWNIKGDSIVMTQQVPDKSIYKLHLKIDKNRATFNGAIDFDGEGIDNDEYFGIQKKVEQ